MLSEAARCNKGCSKHDGHVGLRVIVRHGNTSHVRHVSDVTSWILLTGSTIRTAVAPPCRRKQYTVLIDWQPSQFDMHLSAYTFYSICRKPVCRRTVTDDKICTPTNGLKCTWKYLNHSCVRCASVPWRHKTTKCHLVTSCEQRSTLYYRTREVLTDVEPLSSAILWRHAVKFEINWTHDMYNVMETSHFNWTIHTFLFFFCLHFNLYTALSKLICNLWCCFVLYWGMNKMLITHGGNTNYVGCSSHIFIFQLYMRAHNYHDVILYDVIYSDIALPVLAPSAACLLHSSSAQIVTLDRK